MTDPVTGRWAEARADVPAGVVVFLVALPLCLGIAQASGAPLVAGLVGGVVGGVVVAAVSGSSLSVSGPAAGLAVIVAAGIEELGYPGFLLAVVLAGVLQVAMGALRLGAVAHFVPSAVVKGMLAAIGLLIVLRQLPHAIGTDRAIVGSADGGDAHALATLLQPPDPPTPAAVVVSVFCAAVLLGWPRLQRTAGLKLVPPALLAVVGGGALAAVLGWAGVGLEREQMVALPTSIADALTTPAFARVLDPAVWKVALTIAAVASLETLLSLEAVDRLDPQRRTSPPNRELFAQGLGNVCSGLLGGLPVTSVIVRSSANVQAGARTRRAAIVHGLLLLAGTLFLAPVLAHVPLAALAVVLVFVGGKLATPALWRSMYRAGPTRFVPFVVTVVVIIATDLLQGTLAGVVASLAFSIRARQRNAVEVKRADGRTDVVLRNDVTFLQKARLAAALRDVPRGSVVVIDRRAVDHVDDDIEEFLDDCVAAAPRRDARVEVLWEDGGRARHEARLRPPGG
jgi:carbonic anhydrase